MTRNKAGVRIEDGTFYVTQAQRVVDKFGGARNLARALDHIGKKKDPSAIYKWTYEEASSDGGGMIPSHAMLDIVQAARAEGILLTAEDLDPRPRPVEMPQKRVRRSIRNSKPLWKPKDT